MSFITKKELELGSLQSKSILCPQYHAGFLCFASRVLVHSLITLSSLKLVELSTRKCLQASDRIGIKVSILLKLLLSPSESIAVNEHRSVLRILL